jgi:pimeloyl-ACP methyl ester carboxylesterase
MVARRFTDIAAAPLPRATLPHAGASRPQALPCSRLPRLSRGHVGEGPGAVGGLPCDPPRHRQRYHRLAWFQLGRGKRTSVADGRAANLDRHHCFWGFYLQPSLPEVDPVNFAPRVKIPVLMLNGRFDFFYPPPLSQEPMFQFLGTPAEHKRRIVYETSHALPRNAVIKEVVDWMEKYWGYTR